MIKPGFGGYLSLKKEYAFTHRGVQLNQVLSLQLLQISYNLVDIEGMPLKDCLRLINKTLNLDILRDAFRSHNIVSTYIFNRNDYRELLNSYFNKCSDYQQIFLPSIGYKHRWNTGNIARAFSFVFLRPHSGTFKQKLYLAGYLVYYMNILDTLSASFAKDDLKGKKYIPFNSAFDLETLLTLFFKQNKVDTYHISHGLSYVGYNNQVPIDAVNGENITAAKVLVWGKTSKTDLVNINHRDVTTITIAGNPKYAGKPINVKREFSKGIVFLGRSIYDDDNARLIALMGQIGNRYGMQFSIKAHPLSNLAVFGKIAAENNIDLLPKEKTISDTLQGGGYDFAIAYNTTVYYEAMYYNMICLRYGVNENEAYQGLDDKFYDEASFMKKIAGFQTAAIDELNKNIEQVLTDNLGMGINKYGEIFTN